MFKKRARDSLSIRYSISADTIFFDQLKIPEKPEPMDMNAALQPRTTFVRQTGFKWMFRNDDENREIIPLAQDGLPIQTDRTSRTTLLFA